MSRGGTGHGEVTQGKPGVASMAIAAWLRYAASGNVAVCLKTDKDLLTAIQNFSRTRIVNRKCTYFINSM